ncbi:MAG: amidase, partial [Verrucomicrobia bacterium]|nr:amidase [Verrucomicrobiota bacterium]
TDGFPGMLLDFEVVGPMTRTVVDLVSIMRVISPADRRDPLSTEFSHHPFEIGSTPATRILYVPRFGSSPVDPEVTSSVTSAARSLAELGHVVVEGVAPFDVDSLAQPWSTISQAGLAWMLGSHSYRPEVLTPAMQELAAKGASISAADYYSALDAVRVLKTTLSRFFERYDLILTPSAAALPWPAQEPYPRVIADQDVGPRGHAVFTGFANMAGCPGINIPTAPSANGLPIGFQLVSAQGRDDLLCAIASQYETAHPWSNR